MPVTDELSIILSGQRTIASLLEAAGDDLVTQAEVAQLLHYLSSKGEALLAQLQPA